jgi:hypothetical protein
MPAPPWRSRNRDARDIIATCRSAWGTVHASQSGGAEADESALTVCVASCEKLEELGYSVEERSGELEINACHRLRTSVHLVTSRGPSAF